MDQLSAGAQAAWQWLSEPIPYSTYPRAAVVGLLESVLRHPEPRVRYAVVASLSQTPPREARPLLQSMLEGADTRTFCSVLQVLGGTPDSLGAAAGHNRGAGGGGEGGTRP